MCGSDGSSHCTHLRPMMGPADDHLKLNGESIGTQRKLSNQVWWSGSALSSICVHFIPSIGPEEEKQSMNKVLVIYLAQIFTSIKLFYKKITLKLKIINYMILPALDHLIPTPWMPGAEAWQK